MFDFGFEFFFSEADTSFTQFKFYTWETDLTRFSLVVNM